MPSPYLAHEVRYRCVTYAFEAFHRPLALPGRPRQVMADRFAVWNEITGATTTAAA